MLLRVEKLSKQYRHRDGLVDALKDISLTIDEGMFVTITGPSGSGKSTLLLTLGGLIHPSSGHILFKGKPLYPSSDKELARFRREHVGFVMQNFSLIPYLSALKNVAVPLALRQTDRSIQASLAAQLLASVGLQDRINHLPRELSSGQQQRVAIARAIANNPSLILADEPTGNLDPTLAQEILEILCTLNAEKGVTIIMVTHSPQAANLGKLRLRLNEGHLV
ncbi:MAG TPA: ABC transporter ATP-binding protein [Thermodesulfobacteriota bacterium]|nr:ABC transporter ATP-binding protein [Thermodesulfobacteriota bacterium]HNU72907.1 ABC transporter ATP-binding protein [Thermodesulfobacteriota bacterium]HQO78460.1 ABC transporter ATP-binding protein [Thermodesulfobacteriota bacterium]